MKIVTDRESLLKPLTQISGVIERRQTLPILANALLNARTDNLTITATDLEIEMRTGAEISCDGEVDFTLPARKLIDICKALPEGAKVDIDVEGDRAKIRSGKSRFTLGLLPAQDYPLIDPTVSTLKFSTTERLLKVLIEKTHFAMAQQDVRYYLNGMLLEVSQGRIRAVATDGHRLATSEDACEIDSDAEVQVIIPRKAVLELGRLLTDSENSVDLEISSNHIRIHMADAVFTSKLIDGKFPDYNRVIPRDMDKNILANKEELKSALQRTSILSNEKYRGIRFQFTPGLLGLLAHNPEQEEAQDEMAIDYEGPELIIGFNVGYLLEVLSAIDTEAVRLQLSDSNSSCLIEDENTSRNRYVIMPMRL